MAFATNYSEVNSYDLIPEGNYEAMILTVQERTTKNGSVGLNVRFVIRNDVEQKYKNRSIFHTLWKRKNPTAADEQVQGYSFNQVMQLAKAANLPSGKNYETLEELCADLIGKAMCITVKHDDYNDREFEIVTFMKESAFPECHHTVKTAVSSDTVAQRPQEQFASPPKAGTGGALSIGSLDDFEEILGDGDVPF